MGGGRGGGRGVGGEGTRDFGAPLPHTDSPNPLEAAKLHRRDLGAHLQVHTDGPPPPPTMAFLRGGGQWGGD